MMCDELWRHVNIDNQLLCELQYDGAMDFTGGFVVINKGDKWTFVNTEAKEVAVPTYDEMRSFRHGRVAVCLDGPWGLIDTRGGQTLTPCSDEVIDFEEGGITFGILDEEVYTVLLGDKAITTKGFRQFTTNKM